MIVPESDPSCACTCSSSGVNAGISLDFAVMASWEGTMPETVS
jgi:hypothetical protein